MDPKSLPPEVWEAICRRCGKCCAEKLEVDGVTYITKKMCRFLDLGSRRCTVYADRYRAEPECLSTFEGLSRIVFPADCPYTKSIPGYVAPREQWDDEEIDRLIEETFGKEAI